MEPGDKVLSWYTGKVMTVVDSPVGLLLKGTNGKDTFYTPLSERDRIVEE